MLGELLLVRVFLRDVRDFRRLWRLKHEFFNGYCDAILLRLLKTFGRLAISFWSMHSGLVVNSRYSILWFSFMMISDLSYRWLCRMRTMFWPNWIYRLLDYRSRLIELSAPIMCPWKIFIRLGETVSLFGIKKFLVVGSNKWLSCWCSTVAATCC